MLHNISYCIPFLFSGKLLYCSQSSSKYYLVKSQLRRFSITTDSKNDCVKFVAVGSAVAILGVNANSATGVGLERRTKPITKKVIKAAR